MASILCHDVLSIGVMKDNADDDDDGGVVDDVDNEACAKDRRATTSITILRVYLWSPMRMPGSVLGRSVRRQQGFLDIK